VFLSNIFEVTFIFHNNKIIINLQLYINRFNFNRCVTEYFILLQYLFDNFYYCLLIIICMFFYIYFSTYLFIMYFNDYIYNMTIIVKVKIFEK